jgi:cobalamin biosynthesis Mg chelatase CobN
MRKAKKPFVTVFVTQDGRFAAHAVSPGGERIYIPRLPEAVATAKKSEATARENATTVPPAPARTLTAEEISEVLRQSQKRQSNTVAITPAPLIIRESDSQTKSVPAETSSKASVETLARTPAASVPASDTTASPARSAAVSNAPSAIAPASPVRTGPSAPTGEKASTPGDPIVPSAPPKDRLPVATTETAVGDTGEALAHSPGLPQTAVLAQQQPLSNTPIYLLAAVALLLVALILGWLYIRSIRYVPRPSLISRSLEKEKK